MRRYMLQFVFHRCSGLIRASALAVLFTLTVACDDPAREAELAAEDEELADGEDEHAPGSPSVSNPARELATASDLQFGPPESVCCSIDWSIPFSPRLRLSTMSSEGCTVFNWPPTVTARVAHTVYHEYGSPGPVQGLAAWMAPNTVTYLPVSSLNASHCVAHTIP
jgi:hypothetical protein